jgi:hypothetical protein
MRELFALVSAAVMSIIGDTLHRALAAINLVDTL